MELKYSYEDSKPDGKDNYYRIAQEDFNDNKTISETRLVSFANDQNAIRTFPNPVINTIYVQGVTKGSDLVLTDIKGSVIMRTTAKSATVSIPSDKLSPGIYFVGISNDNAMLKTVKIIKI
ncbi:MAG: T9SS type A sorting domain-containing protein [Bacteroidota bacterium]